MHDKDKWKGNEHCRCTQGCNTASDKLHRQNAALLWPTWRSAHADISNIFHFPSVIDINLLTMVQYTKLQSSCQTVHYPQTPYHIRSLPMVHRSLPLFTETYDYRQPSEPSYPKSIVPASCLVEPIYNNWIINNTRQKARAWSAVYWIAVARSAHVVQTIVPLVCPLMSILALFAGSQWFSISGYKQIYNYE